MTTPVARGELRQELATLEHRFDAKLELWAGAIVDRVDKRFAVVDQRFEQIDQRFASLSLELASHARAIAEAVRGEIRVLDDKYTDLPDRVRKLEEAVFTSPAPRKRPARRRRSA